MQDYKLPEPVPGEVLMVVSMSQLISMLTSHADPATVIRSVEKLPLFPIAMVLHCPQCHKQHIDAPEPEDPVARSIADNHRDPMAGYREPWRNPPHRSHLCAHCGCIWRPADVPTTGVESVTTRGKHDTWPTS